MYPKGGNMLHTLRQIVNNDEKWREILRGLNSTFYHQTVTTKQIEDYLSNATGVNLTAFFNQYLRDTRIPTLEYFFKKGFINFRWTNCVSGFDMPVKVTLNGAEQVLAPKTEWKNIATKTENQKLDVNRNFYVASFNITE